jgi:hypothetical protein
VGLVTFVGNVIAVERKAGEQDQGTREDLCACLERSTLLLLYSRLGEAWHMDDA